jgi:hypothetical protein
MDVFLALEGKKRSGTLIYCLKNDRDRTEEQIGHESSVMGAFLALEAREKNNEPFYCFQAKKKQTRPKLVTTIISPSCP